MTSNGPVAGMANGPAAAEPGSPNVGPVLDRVGARVLLVDAAERVLLLLGTDPADPQAGTWWFTPGGGVDPGESLEQAARRELAEETGLVLADVGPPVWVRTAHFSFMGRRYRQAETFFLARVAAHRLERSGWSDVERLAVLGHRWWPLADLAATDEVVYPRALAAELRRLLRDGPPAEPRNIGP